MALNEKAVPALKRRRPAGEKPPLPENMQAEAEEALARHAKRRPSPGVAVDIERTGRNGYVLSPPHNDRASWMAMICDAFGTRSESTAEAFMYQLVRLCSQNWHPDETADRGGEWFPDEGELNFILNMLAEYRPKNALQAAQVAQAIAVHLMTMKASERALSGYADARTAAIAGKLARTFVMQMDSLEKMKGRKTTRQRITVSYEKHEHKHVHMHGGEDKSGGQPHAAPGTREPEILPPLPREGSNRVVVPLSRDEGQERLPDARRLEPRRAKGGG